MSVIEQDLKLLNEEVLNKIKNDLTVLFRNKGIGISKIHIGFRGYNVNIRVCMNKDAVIEKLVGSKG